MPAWTLRPASARPPCWPSGGRRPAGAGWPGSRWTRATTTPHASGSMWSRRCAPSSRAWGQSRWRPWARPSADLDRVVLPGLLNELSTVGVPLLLVLDDYHLITNPTCHQTLGLFLDHLPADVHVVLSTRADPPLPLARMRARGELAELRVADLQFTDEEALALLNGPMGLELADRGRGQRLAERTEGWAAGLVLAGLSLRGRQDPSAFIASSTATTAMSPTTWAPRCWPANRRPSGRSCCGTSVLERLSGPLCDAVLETEGSAAAAGRAGALQPVPGAAGRPAPVVSLPPPVRGAAAPGACQPGAWAVWCCTGGPRPGTGRPARSMRPSVTPARLESSPRPGR